MSKTFKATWLGDEDPSAQLIRMGDLCFIKGEATDVPSDHGYVDSIRDNPMFAGDGTKAEIAQASEPSDEEITARAEEGTEKGAIKAQLRSMGVDVKGNPSLDTLRNRLVDATK